MHGIYNFVVGPLAWAAFIIFVGGSIYKLWSMYSMTKKRDAIVLAFIEGYTHEELSTRLGSPLGTVKSWIRRGLSRLKDCLDQ